MAGNYQIRLSGRHQTLHGSCHIERTPPVVQDRVGTRKLARICAQLAKTGVRGPHVKLQRALASPLSKTDRGNAWRNENSQAGSTTERVGVRRHQGSPENEKWRPAGDCPVCTHHMIGLCLMRVGSLSEMISLLVYKSANPCAAWDSWLLIARVWRPSRNDWTAADGSAVSQAPTPDAPKWESTPWASNLLYGNGRGR